MFALNYGVEIMKNMGTEVNTVKACHANMFLSPLFGETFATITGAHVELYNTEGSQGAARGAGIGSGFYPNYQEAFIGLDTVKTIDPNTNLKPAYDEAYNRWKAILKNKLDCYKNVSNE